MLTLLAKLLQALNSENSSRQIAAAIALALFFGLAPVVSLQSILVIFLVLFLKVHLATFIVFAGLFSGVGYLLSKVTIATGEALLTSASLQGLFASLYQLDIFKLTHLHHTYNLGAWVIGLVIMLPCYFIAKALVDKYRTHIKAFFEQLYIVKVLKATKVFRLYGELSSRGGM